MNTKNDRYEEVTAERQTIYSVKRKLDGCVFSVGDTITLSGTDAKNNPVEKECRITEFSYNEFGDLYFHTNLSYEHRTMIGILDNAVNKTKEKIEEAKKLLISAGYDCIKRKIDDLNGEEKLTIGEVKIG